MAFLWWLSIRVRQVLPVRGEDAISTSGFLLSQPADSPAKGTPFPGVSVTWVASDLSWLGAPSTTVFEQGMQPTDLRKPIVGEL